MGRYLNLEEAYSICRWNHPTGECDDFLDLSAYSQASPEALELLATQGHRAGVIFGLTSVSVENAAVIANWGVIVEFTNLARLGRETAALFNNYPAPVSISGLDSIEVEDALELSTGPYVLSITCRDVPSLEIVKVLAKHQGEVHLSCLGEPPMEVQRALLYEHQGYRTSINFPTNSDVNKYSYLNWFKTIQVSSTIDISGATWLYVDAIRKDAEEMVECENWP